jgi:inhibitor of cysteine peptidase
MRWIVLLMIFAAGLAAQTAFAATKTITDADNGTVVHIRYTDKLEVKLESNPTTGFMWYVMTGSTPLVKVKGQKQTLPEEGGLGQPVFQIFTFEPKHVGSGELKMHYVCSWEPPSPDEKQFSVHVIIE